MKAGQLKTVTAKAMCVPETAVHVTMRIIREGEKLTTGAHGVNAPDMLYLDAARVLIAQLVDDAPGRAAIHHVNDFGALPLFNRASPWSKDPFTLQSMVPDVSFETFEDAIAALIRVFAECRHDPRMIDAGTRLRDGGWNKPKCRVELFPRDHWARIDMAGVSYDFGILTKARDFTPDNDENTRLGRQNVCYINQEVIALIADGFASDKVA